MAATEDSKRNFVQKPEKPDQELFDKNLKIAQDEHAAAREKLVSSCPTSPTHSQFGHGQNLSCSSIEFQPPKIHPYSSPQSLVMP